VLFLSMMAFSSKMRYQTSDTNQHEVNMHHISTFCTCEALPHFLHLPLSEPMANQSSKCYHSSQPTFHPPSPLTTSFLASHCSTNISPTKRSNKQVLCCYNQQKKTLVMNETTCLPYINTQLHLDRTWSFHPFPHIKIQRNGLRVFQ
jgi:hypothetical protein